MSADVVHQKDESGSVPHNSEPLHSLTEDLIVVYYWTRVKVERQKFSNHRPIVAQLQDGLCFVYATGFLSWCSGQRMLEDFEAHLDKETSRRDGLLDKFNRQSHILFDVKSGVEHLADKLSHLKAVSSSLGQAIVIIIE